MFKYQKFLIRPTDHFDPVSYPSLEEKISLAKEELNLMPSLFRTEMLISFLKDHFISTEQAAANPGLARMISSKVLPLSDFEELFESSKNNLVYRSELESYIKEQFEVAAVVLLPLEERN